MGNDNPDSGGDRGSDGCGERRGGAHSPHDGAGLDREEGELIDHGVVHDGCGHHITRLELVGAFSRSRQDLSTIMSTLTQGVVVTKDSPRRLRQ